MPVYLHDGSMGDIIYALPVLREQPGTLSIAKSGQLEFLKPLLELQPYVEKVVNGVTTSDIIDLRKYRGISEADLSLHLSDCHALAAGVEINHTTPWLEGITPTTKCQIIVNWTGRYRGKLDYPLLRHCEWRAGFVGKREEYVNFAKQFHVTMEYIHVPDALVLAQVIRGSQLFIGNQSLSFAIAEGMAHPRILEVSEKKPNCMPHTAGGETKLTKRRLEQWAK